MENVVRFLADGLTHIKGKVDDIMGGKVLKMEWLDKYDAAVAKGRAEGKAEGKAEGLAEGESERKKLEERIQFLESELKKIKTAMI